MSSFKSRRSSFSAEADAAKSNPVLLSLAFLVACTIGFYAGRVIDKRIYQTTRTDLAMLGGESSAASVGAGEGAPDSGELDRRRYSIALGRMGEAAGAESSPDSPLLLPSDQWVGEDGRLPIDGNMEKPAALRGGMISRQYLRASFVPSFQVERISGRFDLSRPESYVEFGLAGDSHGAHYLRLFKDRVAVLYEVSSGERAVISERQVPEISGDELAIRFENARLAIEQGERQVFALPFGPENREIRQNLRTGRLSFSSNLNKAEISDFRITSHVEGAAVTDVSK